MTPTDGKTILLAEDEQVARMFVHAMLQKNGYNVIIAGDGQDALEKSRQHQGTIHLLLADVLMPHMSGIQLAAQLEIEQPHIRILLMSGMHPGILALKQGWAFLAKPFMPEVLRLKVQNLLHNMPKDGAPATGAAS